MLVDQETFIHGVTGSLLTTESKDEIAGEIIEWMNRGDRWLKNSSANSMSNARSKFSTETMYEKLIDIYNESGR